MTDTRNWDPATVTIEFARAFCAGDVGRLEELLDPALKFRGPLLSCDSREEYLASLRGTLDAADCRVLEVLGNANSAAILYEYAKSDAVVVVAQFNHVTEGRITCARLVFDTAEM